MTTILLSLLNHECNTEANKYIWESLTIVIQPDRNDTMGSVPFLTAVIPRDPKRAECLKNLAVSVPKVFDMQWLSLDSVFAATKYTPNLKRLEVLALDRHKPGDRAPEVNNTLHNLHLDLPFRLKEFRTTLPASKDLAAFLVSQSDIEIYHHLPELGDVLLPPTSWTNLTHYSSNFAAIVAFLETRGHIKAITVSRTPTCRCTFHSLVRALDRNPDSEAFQQLAHLRMSLDTLGDFTEILHDLSSRLPGLITLEVFSTSAVAMSSLISPPSCSNISKFKLLQTVILSAPIMLTPTIFEPCHACPTLRKVDISFVFSSKRLIWEREDVEDLWKNTWSNNPILPFAPFT